MSTDPDDIAELAADIADDVSGSRLHGALAGGLCCGMRDDAGWMRVLEASIGLQALDGALRQLLMLTDATLADPDYGFEPLLPDGGEPLAERVAALGEWCDAFVLAFAAGSAAPPSQDGDGVELLSDLNAIACGLDPDAVGPGDEEDEHDFMQLVEFVRIAALNLYTTRGGPPSTTTAH